MQNKYDGNNKMKYLGTIVQRCVIFPDMSKKGVSAVGPQKQSTLTLEEQLRSDGFDVIVPKKKSARPEVSAGGAWGCGL
jgi:hypothetical protein